SSRRRSSECSASSVPPAPAADDKYRTPSGWDGRYGSVFPSTCHVAVSLAGEPVLKFTVTLKVCVPGGKKPPWRPGQRNVWPPPTRVPGRMHCTKGTVTSAPSKVACPPAITRPGALSVRTRSKAWVVTKTPDGGEIVRGFTEVTS